MEKVTGIGGLFFRAQDPSALARWYDEYLGVTVTPTNYNDNGRFARLYDPEGNPIELRQPAGGDGSCAT
jgi:hypothetical protein